VFKTFTQSVKIRFAWILLMAGLLASQSNLAASPKYEMRGLWVATVYGIDWPSTAGSTAAVAEAQKKELLALLDLASSSGLNAVMLQVRPMADALYKSSLEPWSAYLTGSRGTAPASGWDPLAYAVKEAHARGLELHAWVNPFRFSTSVNLPSTPGDRKAIENKWTLTHKKSSGKKVSSITILDPGNPDARKHIVDVCREIIHNYDVDGLVFDDYFYPEKFPIPADADAEEESDVRRQNVATAISEVYSMIKTEKPWIRFGVAPAGVAGGNGKATSEHGLLPPRVGRDWMYNDIYCDPLRWLADGTIDYVSPQLYWPINHATNPFEPLVEWWTYVAKHFGRHLFVSQNVPSLPAGAAAWKEQRQEVEICRSQSEKRGIAPGEIFYSAAHLSGKKARGLGDELSANEYANKALLPPMKWKEAKQSDKVRNLVRQDKALSWFDREKNRYVIYAVPLTTDPIEALASDGPNFDSKYIIGVSYTNRFELPMKYLKGYWYAVAVYDRYGNEGEATTLNAPGF
jgi:uncharacterized lipoprotein YddW (UPF0748 family)